VIPSLRYPKEEELTQQEQQHNVALPPQQQPSTPKSDGNLANYLFFKAISQADLFWELDPCGRTRALRTLFERKRVAVEVVSTCYVALPDELIATKSPEQLNDLVYETANSGMRPALLAEDAFIEPEFLFRYKGRRQVLHGRFGELMNYTLNRHVTALFLTITNRRRRLSDISGWQFSQTKQWTCATWSAGAIRQIQEIHRRLLDDYLSTAA
jgi:hypothetical protein